MEGKTITLSLTVEQVNTVLAALSELPFKQVADLVSVLGRQASTQLSVEDAPTEEQ